MPHHQQLRVVGVLQQVPHGPVVHHLAADGHVGIVRLPAGERLGQRRVLALLDRLPRQVRLVQVHQRHVAPRVHHLQLGAARLRLGEGEGQRPHARLRAVHPHHHGPGTQRALAPAPPADHRHRPRPVGDERRGDGPGRALGRLAEAAVAQHHEIGRPGGVEERGHGRALPQARRQRMPGVQHLARRLLRPRQRPHAARPQRVEEVGAVRPGRTGRHGQLNRAAQHQRARVDPGVQGGPACGAERLGRTVHRRQNRPARAAPRRLGLAGPPCTLGHACHPPSARPARPHGFPPGRWPPP